MTQLISNNAVCKKVPATVSRSPKYRFVYQYALQCEAWYGIQVGWEYGVLKKVMHDCIEGLLGTD